MVTSYLFGQPNEKWIILTTPTTLAAAVADKTFLIKSDELHQNTVQGSAQRYVYQFPFRWIYNYGSNKSTGEETGKMHLCAVGN